MRDVTARRVALVVGGSGGIGRAVCRRLREADHVVVAADAAPGGEEESADVVVPVDIARGEDVDRLFARVRRETGDPDLVAVTSGIGVHERLDEGDPESWRRVVDVNLLGTLRIVRAFVPAMRERGAGDVVLVSSVAAARAYPYGGAYAASKAGLERAAEALRLETLPEVRVTTVAPGVVRTPFFQRMAGSAHTPEEIGWGALEPDDVARAILFAVQQPRQVAVGSITLRPAGQPL